jgi:hypothetical protein
MTEPKSVSATVPPVGWRIIHDPIGPPESYIPVNTQPHSIAMLLRSRREERHGDSG